VEAETAPVALPFNLEIVWQLLAGHVSLTTLKIEGKEEFWLLHNPFSNFAWQPHGSAGGGRYDD
jgi:hypothetical protein